MIGRDSVLAEGVTGGFAGLYPVFAELEDSGIARRGYFVEGLGGAQFGLPGAVNRLRSREDGGFVVVAASDPANVYGAAVPWPECGPAQPARREGAFVALDDGRLVAYVERGGRRVASFVDDGSPASLMRCRSSPRGSANGRWNESTVSSPLSLRCEPTWSPSGSCPAIEVLP